KNAILISDDSYVIVDLGTLGGEWSSGAAINASGQVAGTSVTSDEIHAFIATAGTMTDLGTLGGRVSSARGMNALGGVVGSAETISGESHAFVYRAHVMTDL